MVARGSSAWASSLPAEPIETAARIFRAEAQDGYRDRVVIGGLSAFVNNLGVESLIALFEDYAALEPQERATRLKQAAALLKISYKALLYKIRQYGIAQSRSTHRLSAGA